MSFDFRKQNMGQSDRAIRGLIGAGFILYALTHASSTATWIGLLILATAYLRTCPLYTLIDHKTN